MRIATLGIALALAACSKTSPTETVGPRETAPTYHRDIAPLVEVKCNGCHVEGGIAPFPLASYEQVVSRKEAIRAAVVAGTMPPWPPADGCSDYLGDRALDAEEKATLTKWIDDGAPAGDPGEQPVHVADDRAKLSRVDRTIVMPVPYTPQISPDDYRCFLVDWPDTETVYVTGVGVLPGQPSIVHHVIGYLAAPSQVTKLEARDAADPGPGWTCFGGAGGAVSGWVGAWAPGAIGADYPEGTGIEIAPGSKIVLQVHYNTASAPAVPDQSSMVVKVDTSVTKKAVMMPWTNVDWVLGQKMDIPAHSEDVVHAYSADPTPYLSYLSHGAIPAGAPFTLYTAGLHMHTRGTRALTRIERGGGGEECLLDIEKWDFHWQGAYAFRAPKRFDPGDKLSVECHWDNPGASDLNWGEGTGDEMCLGVFYATE